MRNTSINDLDIPTRSKNGLWQHGFRTAGGLADASDQELLRAPEMGKVGLARVRAELARLGVTRSIPEKSSPGMSPGMTLRDYFAGQALAGILARDHISPKADAEFVYAIADAMLAARERS